MTKRPNYVTIIFILLCCLLFVCFALWRCSYSPRPLLGKDDMVVPWSQGAQADSAELYSTEEEKRRDELQRRRNLLVGDQKVNTFVNITKWSSGDKASASEQHEGVDRGPESSGDEHKSDSPVSNSDNEVSSASSSPAQPFQQDNITTKPATTSVATAENFQQEQPTAIPNNSLYNKGREEEPLYFSRRRHDKCLVPAPIELRYVLQLIESRRSFAFLRFGDGEHIIAASQRSLYTQDTWSFNVSLDTELVSDLRNSFLHKHPHYLVSITYPVFTDACIFLVNLTQTYSVSTLSYATLFHDLNYPIFEDWFQRNIIAAPTTVQSNASGIQRIPTVVIGPSVFINQEEGTGSFPSWAIDALGFSDTAVNYWAGNRTKWLGQVVDLAKKYQQTLFALSVGPLSKIFIHHMWIANPNNMYVDFGSALHRFVGQKKYRRMYVDPESYFSWRLGGGVPVPFQVTSIINPREVRETGFQMRIDPCGFDMKIHSVSRGSAEGIYHVVPSHFIIARNSWKLLPVFKYGWGLEMHANDQECEWPDALKLPFPLARLWCGIHVILRLGGVYRHPSASFAPGFLTFFDERKILEIHQKAPSGHEPNYEQLLRQLPASSLLQVGWADDANSTLATWFFAAPRGDPCLLLVRQKLEQAAAGVTVIDFSDIELSKSSAAAGLDELVKSFPLRAFSPSLTSWPSFSKIFTDTILHKCQVEPIWTAAQMRKTLISMHAEVYNREMENGLSAFSTGALRMVTVANETEVELLQATSLAAWKNQFPKGKKGVYYHFRILNPSECLVLVETLGTTPNTPGKQHLALLRKFPVQHYLQLSWNMKREVCKLAAVVSGVATGYVHPAVRPAKPIYKWLRALEWASTQDAFMAASAVPSNNSSKAKFSNVDGSGDSAFVGSAEYNGFPNTMIAPWFFVASPEALPCVAQAYNYLAEQLTAQTNSNEENDEKDEAKQRNNYDAVKLFTLGMQRGKKCARQYVPSMTFTDATSGSLLFNPSDWGF